MATYSPSKITKDGNTYNFTDATKIPLAGTNALAGSIVPDTDISYSLGSTNYRFLEGYFGNLKTSGLFGNADNGIDINYLVGANLILRGKNRPNETGIFWLVADDGSNSSKMMGSPDGTFTWNGQPIQYGSDQRLKQQIAEIDDKLLDAWEDVDLVQFKYNDAVNEKGTKARLHTGYVVQQIDKACASHGVDVSQYGLYCHEEYPQETEEVEVEQADGTKTKEKKVIREASEHYSLRYTEVYAVECMYLRRCIKQLTARIEELEKGNNSK